MLGEGLKETIVLSGINMMDGGALTIMAECLSYADAHLSQQYNVIALVHRKNLFKTKNICYLEFPDSKSSWFKRIRYEYFDFKKLSEKLSPLLWLSLHDMSPNVTAQVRAVYCHNPAPFFKPGIKTALVEPKLLAFKALYKYLYKINIQKNDYVIVQQKWIREEFKKLFSLTNVIVAYPIAEQQKSAAPKIIAEKDANSLVKTFFYPSFPRVFKNFEAVLQASKLLRQKGYKSYKIIITIAGNENKYAAQLHSQFKNDPCIVWSGLLPREEIFKLYGQTDCLLFPSKLETWGLPISEFRDFNKSMILADLPYARETAEGYEKARFVDHNDAGALAEAMEAFLNNNMIFNPTHRNVGSESELNVNGWGELFNVLLHTK